MDASGDIIQLKVRLLGISPMAWRRVTVPTTMTLRELHGVLQVVMGWKGIHLYAFDIYAVQYGSFELMIGSPRAPLTQFTFRTNDKFSYTYDMGDGWVHEIRVEGLGAADPKKTYPVPEPAHLKNVAGQKVTLRAAMKRMGMAHGRISVSWLSGWMI